MRKARSSTRSGQALPFVRPNPASLLKRIRFLAAEDTGKIIWGEHCLDRASERGITTEDALRVLRTGEAAEDFSPGLEEGEWKTKVVAPLKGSRKAGVVTIVMTNTGHLFIKTVEWEDR